jgi:pimeloyl-ACP methyl ester carboxylesterase
VSWYHRGTGGSERPRRRRDVTIDDFVADALAVMADAGLDRVPVMGWSMGVNTAFELAVRHPGRVSGLFAVAGVPGSTFASMLAPARLPRGVAQALTVNAARVLKYAGPAINPVTQRLRMGRLGVGVLTHSGFMLPTPDTEGTGRAVRDFLTTPVDWYGHVALATAKHRRVPLGTIRVPTSFVAGRWDVLAGARDMASAAARIPGATYVELPATHFVQMERPEEVHALLLDFLATVEG